MEKPNVYYFNPTCELAVANGSFSYMPPLLLQEMERDLSTLPFVFAGRNDFVVTEKLPGTGFIQKLKEVGFEAPEFCRLAELEGLPTDSLDAIVPWGWSPALHFNLRNLKEKCSDKFKSSPVFDWEKEQKLLFERSTSLDLLTGILNQHPYDWFIDPEMTGEKVNSSEEIEALLGKYSSLVVKAPVSSSGRGIQILRKPGLNTSNKQWISGVLRQQKYLVAEPLLDKALDLSFQFQVSAHSEIDYLGYSIFETSSNGQYRGTLIHPDLKSILPEENAVVVQEMIGITAKVIGEALKKSVYSKIYQGFIGVDALIFRHQEQLRMQPCIEVNSRMNMGILAMFLEKRISPDTSGKFELFYGSPGEFENFARIQAQNNPLRFKDGKLCSGFLPLVEPDRQKKFGAYILTGEAK
ncbi:MAG: hypothetical protein Q8N05_08955 [Bacteroidota bacterium]|nr:hypothetical protein [Bacteroidota bacterium]